MKTITIHTGQSVEDLTGRERHPVNAVKLAKYIFYTSTKKILTLHSNSPDFIKAMSALAEKNHIPIEFFVNGVKGDIEKVFENFNRSLDLINEISQIN
jgi:hypothetical protein